MSTTLSIAHKLLSLRDRIEIRDEAGDTKYTAKNANIFWSLSFHLDAAHGRIAHIRRKLLALRQTWIVTTDNERYLIRKKWLSLTKKFVVIGGQYDGALISANIFGLKFEINQNENLIAKAAAKILTLRDRHVFEVFNPADEQFVAIAMLIVLKSDERKRIDIE